MSGVLGPRMHHLILNRSMAPSTMSRAQQLLAGLQATGDESRQLQVFGDYFFCAVRDIISYPLGRDRNVSATSNGQ